MDIDKIIELGKLGYSKEEIKELMSTSDNGSGKSVTQVYNVDTEEASEGSAGSEEATSESPTLESKSLTDQLNEIKEKMIAEAKKEVGSYIDEVKKDIKSLNIFTTSMNSDRPTDLKAEDIIGKIIAPPTNK